MSRIVVALAMLACAVQIHAETIRRRTIAMEIDDRGRLIERTSLEVVLDEASDLEAWSKYAVYLDEHRELDRLEATVLQPDGSRSPVGRKRRDRVEYAGGGTLYGSAYYQVLELTGLAVGTVLEIEHQVTVTPYYPAENVPLLTDAPIDELEVTVSGPDLRYRIDGPAAGLELEELEHGILIRGSELTPPDPPPLTAGGAATRPVLRFSWGGGRSWQDVGMWYRDLLAELPPAGEPVADLAAELTRGAESDRDRLEALLAYLRSKIRYVAVEVGIGGFRPSPAQAVLERKWGDCKDKSWLLIELLRVSGLEAYPALIRFDEGSRIDREFPSPFGFNHMIVAIPAAQVETNEMDPVSEGLLFLDPTQTLGTAGWLHPGVQDQQALVVTTEGGRLVHTPLLPGLESRLLVGVLSVSPEGDAEGRLGLLMTGQVAAGWIDQIENAATERTAETALQLLERLLPGARFEGLGWEKVDAAVPTVRLAVAVEIDDLIDLRASTTAVRLPSLPAAPEPRLLDETAAPITYRPQMARTVWRLSLPGEGCRFVSEPTAVQSEVGLYRQILSRAEDATLYLERTTELKRRWIDPQQIPLLRELALEEHRSARRRVKIACASSS